MRKMIGILIPIGGGSMRPFGRGILPESQLYFYDPAEADRQIFLYALCAGHYHCSGEYVVKRQNYDSFLMLYVASGEAWVQDGSRRRALSAHGFALLDCYLPHIYGSDTGCELYWVHFDGPVARRYFEIITHRPNLQPAHFDRARRAITELSARTEKDGQLIESPEVNRLLTNLLTEFMMDAGERSVGGQDIIDGVRNYILENLGRELTLEDLADQARMSPFHFSRQFKRYAGVSPHTYLVNARINTARFYLVSSDLTVKEIAYNCGFSSVSSFCTCFKKNVGSTPMDYRNAHLTASV